MAKSERFCGEYYCYCTVTGGGLLAGGTDSGLDGHGDGRRGVDDRQLETLLAQNGQIGCQAGDGGLGESGIFILAFVPPIGERPLRIDIDQDDGTGAGASAKEVVFFSTNDWVCRICDASKRGKPGS